MIDDDGSFELEFTDNTAPAVFEPVTTTVRGRLSPAAAVHFALLKSKHSSERVATLLRAAVENRWRIEGLRAGDLVVRTTDFRR
jgi:hypothetical protein